ncbi:MAG TPA: DUF72 domain-containing protein [Actinomycetota bacterium]|nr:DUF72 domain-containing protein [Actinomycetota bacterium]
MTLYVGTSGWAYKEWKPEFYPREVPQSRFLEHYSTKLNSCEINATFYRVQPANVVARWAAIVPESFRFSAKAHRRLTYTKELAPDALMRSYIDEFVESLLPLGPRLGVVLVQFPAFRERDDAGLKKFLDALPPEMRCAVEFRHESWDAPEPRALVAERGHAFCISDAEGRVPDALPEGELAYVRLRGESYAEDERARLRRLIEQEARKRDVYVFAKHKGALAGSDSSGVGLALWLSDPPK